MALRVPDVADKAFDALAADTTLTALLGGTSRVYSYVPEDVAPPYVLVLGATEVPWADATDSDATRHVDLDVDVYSAYRGTKEVDDLASQVHTRLTAATTWSGLSGYAGVIFIESPRPVVEFIEGLYVMRRRVTVRVYLGS